MPKDAHTHTLHPNSANQRRHVELFEADSANIQQRSEEQVLRVHNSLQYVRNFCKKTFLHRFVKQGTPLWEALALGPMSRGAAVYTTIGMPAGKDTEETWEWRRLYLARDGGVLDLICSLEDVTFTADCRHKTDGVDERHIICKHCLVPMCDECLEYVYYCSTNVCLSNGSGLR